MPEGDSLRRVAAKLTPILTGRVVVALSFHRLKGLQPRPGERIESVDAVGKHLLIRFSGGLTLRTHLGMTGRWRTLAGGLTPRPNPRTRVVITTADGVAVCDAAIAVETYPHATENHVGHLGPDLSDDTFDVEEVVARTRASAGGLTVAEMLLDQRLAAGAGNVFKSEVAFLAGVHPFTPIADLDDTDLAELWGIAHAQLLANRSRSARSTTGRSGARTYVYRRARRPCLRCSTPIAFSPAGEVTARSTYWCPRCQPR